MFFLYANIEESNFPIFPHLVDKYFHRSMRNANQSLNHNKINKLDKVRQPFSVSIGYLQQVSFLFLFSTFKVHRFLLDLLPKFHLILLFHIFNIAFLVDFILNFTNYYCHFVGNDIFVMRTCQFTSLVLLNVEL